MSGRLDQRSYEDKDGNKRSVVEVVVEDFNFVGGRNDGNAPVATPPPATSAKDVVVEDIDDKPIDLSEIPF